MNEFPICPKCNMDNTYFDGTMTVCPDCGHEWDADAVEIVADSTPRDSNGAELIDGDAVTVIKDLKVKGTSNTLKKGTKIKNIRLTDNEDLVECNAEGIKGLVLRTEFLNKS